MGRQFQRAALAAVLALAVAAPALSNDSTAQLGAGGLELTRSEHIEMRSEDLFISEREVRVDYVFRNTGATDQTVLVAFPMPEIGGPDFFYSDVAIPFPDQDNILGFTTRVDGRPVQARVEQKAMANGVDQTAWLKRHGLPLNPMSDAARAGLDALPAAAKAEAERLGVAFVDEYDAGKGWERHHVPQWSLKTTYYWEQVFPVGRDVKVEHRYTPSVGGSVGSFTDVEDLDQADYWPEQRDRYCIEPSLLAGARKQRADGRAPNGHREFWIDYVLTTGANWKKPIGDFRLVVDKGAPENLVSFCAEGVTKTGPTRFEVRHRNWTPTRDLSIVIVKPIKPE